MLIETRAGPVRLRWSERGLTAIEMPELTAREIRQELLDAKTPPRFVQDAVELLRAHLDGAPQDLSGLALDLEGLAPFQRSVYELVRGLPAGTTATYGEIAARLGKPGASRAVGQALGKNPFLVAIPCHRVLAAKGKPGGFSAPGGLFAKRRLLALEGAALELDVGLSFDPEEAVVHLRRSDPKLGAFIERVGPLRLYPSRLQSPFEALAQSIVYQQLSGKAAGTILKRAIELFRPRSFPRPQDLLDAPEDRLRSAGLSRNKIAALRDLAAKTLDGTVPKSVEALAKLSDDEIVERLTEVRGIGRWTVEMLLIFRLGRSDVLPVADLGVRKGLARAHGKRKLPTADQLLRAGEKWRPFRTAASWYLWRITELP